MKKVVFFGLFLFAMILTLIFASEDVNALGDGGQCECVEGDPGPPPEYKVSVDECFDDRVEGDNYYYEATCNNLNGACVCAFRCENECTPGATKCVVGGKMQVCESDDIGCYSWNEYSCGGRGCSDGFCVPDSCSFDDVGTKECGLWSVVPYHDEKIFNDQDYLLNEARSLSGNLKGYMLPVWSNVIGVKEDGAAELQCNYNHESWQQQCFCLRDPTNGECVNTGNVKDPMNGSRTYTTFFFVGEEQELGYCQNDPSFIMSQCRGNTAGECIDSQQVESGICISRPQYNNDGNLISFACVPNPSQSTCEYLNKDQCGIAQGCTYFDTGLNLKIDGEVDDNVEFVIEGVELNNADYAWSGSHDCEPSCGAPSYRKIDLNPTVITEFGWYKLTATWNDNMGLDQFHFSLLKNDERVEFDELFLNMNANGAIPLDNDYSENLCTYSGERGASSWLPNFDEDITDGSSSVYTGACTGTFIQDQCWKGANVDCNKLKEEYGVCEYVAGLNGCVSTYRPSPSCTDFENNRFGCAVAEGCEPGYDVKEIREDDPDIRMQFCCDDDDTPEGFSETILNKYECTSSGWVERGVAECTPDWTCTEWSSCIDGQQTRTCTDNNNCSSEEGKPDETQECFLCEDSDNGKNYITAGNVTMSSSSQTYLIRDACSGSIVNEQFCADEESNDTVSVDCSNVNINTGEVFNGNTYAVCVSDGLDQGYCDCPTGSNWNSSWSNTYDACVCPNSNYSTYPEEGECVCKGPGRNPANACACYAGYTEIGGECVPNTQACTPDGLRFSIGSLIIDSQGRFVTPGARFDTPELMPGTKGFTIKNEDTILFQVNENGDFYLRGNHANHSGVSNQGFKVNYYGNKLAITPAGNLQAANCINYTVPYCRNGILEKNNTYGFRNGVNIEENCEIGETDIVNGGLLESDDLVTNQVAEGDGATETFCWDSQCTWRTNIAPSKVSNLNITYGFIKNYVVATLEWVAPDQDNWGNGAYKEYEISYAQEGSNTFSPTRFTESTSFDLKLHNYHDRVGVRAATKTSKHGQRVGYSDRVIADLSWSCPTNEDYCADYCGRNYVISCGKYYDCDPCPAPPDRPSGLTTTAGWDNTGIYADLSWNAPDDMGTGNFDHYNVYNYDKGIKLIGTSHNTSYKDYVSEDGSQRYYVKTVSDAPYNNVSIGYSPSSVVTLSCPSSTDFCDEYCGTHEIGGCDDTYFCTPC